MSPNIYRKSTLRQPLQTIFLLLLTAAISFAFIARAVEYIIVERETERLGSHYRAVGVLKSEQDDKAAIFKAADFIAASPYVHFEDRRRLSAAVMPHIYDNDSTWASSRSNYFDNLYPTGLHLSDMYVYGKLEKREYDEEAGFGKLAFHIDEVEEALPDYFTYGNRFAIQLRPEFTGSADNIKAILADLTPGNRYFFKIYHDISKAFTLWKLAKPLNDQGLFFVEVEPGKRMDFSDPALSALPNEIEVLNQNLRTMLVIATKDASAVPIMQPSSRFFTLSSGRWMDYNDHLNANPVCMISAEIANQNGLSVGDKISATLRDIDMPYYKMISDDHFNTWKDYPTYDETFEIVGIYQSSYPNLNDIYIPESRMPAGYDNFTSGQIDPNYYSFVLKSTRDISAFLAENLTAVEAFGVTLDFLPNGAQAFWDSAIPIKQSTLFSAALFGGVLLLALLLAVFIYLRLRRREFAILRALGKPRNACVWQMLSPIGLVGTIGIAAGGIASWNYALEKASQTLSALQGPQDVASSAALSPLWLVGLCSIIFVLLLLFTLIGVLLIARRPTLELLQGAASRTKKSRKAVASMQDNESTDGESTANASVALSFELPLSEGKQNGLSVPMRFILRHALRAPFKSILSVVLALCFTVSLGWINLAIRSSNARIELLYTTTPVGMDIVNSPEYYYSAEGGIMYKSTVDKVMESGFAQSVYLEAEVRYPMLAAKATTPQEDGVLWDKERKIEGTLLTAFTDTDTFFNRYSWEIEYAPGYDASLFTMDWGNEFDEIPIIVSIPTLKDLEADIGDTLYFVDDTGFTKPCKVYGRIRSNWDIPELLPLSALEALKRESPGMVRPDVNYSTARFELDPAKNRDLPILREMMNKVMSNPTSGPVALRVVFWDQDLVQAVAPMEKNVQLLSVLYPITIALSAAIAAGLSALLILQNAREAAVLRVLGGTKRRVQGMLCTQQLLLTLIGLVLGLGALGLIRSGNISALSLNALTCAGIYLAGALIGAIFAAAAAVRKMPLELLQVKE